jgi:hypothetical protein
LCCRCVTIKRRFHFSRQRESTITFIINLNVSSWGGDLEGGGCILLSHTTETLINTYIPVERALFVLGMYENRSWLKLQNVMPHEHKTLLDLVILKTLQEETSVLYVAVFRSLGLDRDINILLHWTSYIYSSFTENLNLPPRPLHDA